jgi:hypothetical protein
MPSSRQARITRTAISPRLAIRIFLNTIFLDAFENYVIVIPKRGFIARGICCSVRWQEADSPPIKPARNDKSI